MGKNLNDVICKECEEKLCYYGAELCTPCLDDLLFMYRGIKVKP